MKSYAPDIKQTYGGTHEKPSRQLTGTWRHFWLIRNHLRCIVTSCYSLPRCFPFRRSLSATFKPARITLTQPAEKSHIPAMRCLASHDIGAELRARPYTGHGNVGNDCAGDDSCFELKPANDAVSVSRRLRTRRSPTSQFFIAMSPTITFLAAVVSLTALALLSTHRTYIDLPPSKNRTNEAYSLQNDERHSNYLKASLRTSRAPLPTLKKRTITHWRLNWW